MIRDQRGTLDQIGCQSAAQRMSAVKPSQKTPNAGVTQSTRSQPGRVKRCQPVAGGVAGAFERLALALSSDFVVGQIEPKEGPLGLRFGRFGEGDFDRVGRSQNRARRVLQLLAGKDDACVLAAQPEVAQRQLVEVGVD